MMRKTCKEDRRGSALLIILGFLSFLMLSAVAYSISMRVERISSANYRHGVTGRHLVQIAFAEARAAVDLACVTQASPSERDAADDGDRLPSFADTIPFRVPNTSPIRYSRHISSVSADEARNDGVIGTRAPLLTESMMSHVPAYLIKPLWDVLLDTGTGGENANETDSSPADVYSRKYPCWQYIYSTPYGQGIRLPIGRYAWMVVNVSDSFDINSLGVLNGTRGIGTGGRDFAWEDFAGSNDPKSFFDLTDETRETPVDETNLYKLFKGGFLTLADFVRACSYNDTAYNTFILKSFHWLSAADSRQSNYPPAPFTTYSYWPSLSETPENSGPYLRKDATEGLAGGSKKGEPILCASVGENFLRNSRDELRTRINSITGKNWISAPFQIEAQQSVFLDMLADYILKEDEPPVSALNQGTYSEMSRPATKRTPMINTILYQLASPFVTEQQALPEPQTVMVGETAEVDLTLRMASDFIVRNAVQPIFPFIGPSIGSFRIEREQGFLTLGVACVDGNVKEHAPMVREELTAVQPASVSFPGTVGSPRDQPAAYRAQIISGSMMLAQPDKAPEVTTTLTIEVPSDGGGGTYKFEVFADLYFRYVIKNGQVVVDQVPASDIPLDRFPSSRNVYGGSGSAADKFSDASVDANLFRIRQIYDVVVKYALSEGGSEREKRLEFMLEEVTLRPFDNSAADSRYASSPTEGSWMTIDPRFNWISPMLGVQSLDGFLPGDPDYLPMYSSPHWIFKTGWDDPSDYPNAVQFDFVRTYAGEKPFLKSSSDRDTLLHALVFGSNATGRMYLPGEIGFLPAPPYLAETILANAGRSYRGAIDNPNQVARSMFSSLPLVYDSKTGRCRFTDAEVDTVRTVLSAFTPSFNSLSRGLMHAYPFPKTEKDLFTASRKQVFKMALGGMPPTLQDAVAQTVKDVKAAEKEFVPGATADGLNLENPPTSSDYASERIFERFLTESGASAFLSEQNGEEFDDIQSWDFMSEKSFKLTEKLSNAGFNQMQANLFYSMARESFGERQQLLLFLMRAEAITVQPGQALRSARSVASGRAVALVWRDAYGRLPDRVVYFQMFPN